jgi:hypothetical protein
MSVPVERQCDRYLDLILNYNDYTPSNRTGLLMMATSTTNVMWLRV